MRKLASIQTIIDIIVHPNADSLEICKILGWTLCVMKGQFQKGQQVVFVEPDAILPEGNPAWEFMRERHFRIKTIKLRGVISQGLIFPLSILSEGQYETGQYVDEFLGITQYIPYIPAQLAGEVKGNFPDFLHKSDEIRIQSIPEILEKYQGKKFYVSEKCDGSSWSGFLNNGEFGICSRNLELKETAGNAYWKVTRELDIENKLRLYGKNLGLQGEVIGQGIQSNKYKLPNVQLKIFNIFDIDKRQYLCYSNFIKTAKLLGLDIVPIISEDYALPKTVEELVEFSKGKSVLNKDVHREGIVLRPLEETYEEDLHGRLSFKVINPNFLLKYESE